MSLLVLIASAPASAQASAQAETDQAKAIREAAVIDVPLLLERADASEGNGILWSKGDRPANQLLARATAKPVQVARFAPTGDASDAQLLWRAFPGGEKAAKRSGELKLADGPRTFCGAAGPRSFVCWFDTDGNGEFDEMAEALAERGTKPYHLTIVKSRQPLAKPKPYQILSDDQRPTIPIAISNCDKDYDRPRFVARSTQDQDEPVSYEWHEKDSSFAMCRRGRQVPPTAANAAQIPAGGYLAEIGPLTFAVGPKKNPTLTLIGLTEPDALYRLEAASLVKVAVGPTPVQAQLIARQQFPYPTLLSDKGGTIEQGKLVAGQTLASIPFHHAYRGKLTQDVTITTLLGKRSVSAGTIVYGFPARMQLTWSRGGVPMSMQKAESEFREATMQLTWCAPVQGPPPAKVDERSRGRNGWTAACIPHGAMGTHTVLTGLEPAFAISGVAYDVYTSSNDGPPPIERNDQAEFAAPLRIVYLYDGMDRQLISIAEQIYFGDSLTSQTMKKINMNGRQAVIDIAGAPVELTVTDDAELIVKPAGQPKEGVPPLLTWDQSAMLREQLKKMGLTAVPRQPDDQ
ncbi:hypothetical protein FJQ54_00595 [Sandaracinobacter neustonicus]|uniref:Uncharacterized protein n=1 Tax=Sandaracinobacter neustonicus TaxID=1715348 RepID=A0A501XXJ1_9SPHN|nr:hypothetical protein [Sandaracinobacter neustonicus]TPE64777.1 hypothetical protein FJQ54_00595 [Sandaracinobacter neustonicus]